jgi:inosine-uridine nucleoside N-ribohydrolase
MQGDPDASRVILDSGVPLVLFPCRNVSEMLRTTEAELAKHVAGKSRIGDYLYRILRDYESNPPLTTAGKSKVIWDLAPLAWLVDQGWVSTTINPSPILTADLKWRHDSSRHPIRVAAHIFRDGLFADLFAKLSAA